MRLVRLLKRAAQKENSVHAKGTRSRVREKEEVKKVVELMEKPLRWSEEGFELAKQKQDLGGMGSFIESYMGVVQKWGDATGEWVQHQQGLQMGPVGWPGLAIGGPQIHVQGEKVALMALPRADDPEELVREGRLLEEPKK